MIDYNETIRLLLVAAENWLKKHPGARPRLSKQGSAYGVPGPGNHDARRLLAAIDAEAERLGDVSGAQINQALKVAVMRYNADLRARHAADKYSFGLVLAAALAVLISLLFLGWVLVSCSPDSQ